MSTNMLRILQDLKRLVLVFGLAANWFAISGCVHERSRFNQIQFTVQTGTSALGSSSAAKATPMNPCLHEWWRNLCSPPSERRVIALFVDSRVHDKSEVTHPATMPFAGFRAKQKSP
jgi:hypothetical protein